MGWARLLFLGNVGQQMDIDLHEVERLDDLELENKRLRSALAAVVRVLVDKDVVSEQEIGKVANMLGAQIE